MATSLNRVNGNNVSELDRQKKSETYATIIMMKKNAFSFQFFFSEFSSVSWPREKFVLENIN